MRKIFNKLRFYQLQHVLIRLHDDDSMWIETYRSCYSKKKPLGTFLIYCVSIEGVSNLLVWSFKKPIIDFFSDRYIKHTLHFGSWTIPRFKLSNVDLQLKSLLFFLGGGGFASLAVVRTFPLWTVQMMVMPILHLSQVPKCLHRAQKIPMITGPLDFCHIKI